MAGWDPKKLPAPREFRIEGEVGSVWNVRLEPNPPETSSGRDECFVCRIVATREDESYHSARFSISGPWAATWLAAEGREPNPDGVLDWYQARVSDYLPDILMSPDPKTDAMFTKTFVSEEASGGGPFR